MIDKFLDRLLQNPNIRFPVAFLCTFAVIVLVALGTHLLFEAFGWGVFPVALVAWVIFLKVVKEDL